MTSRMAAPPHRPPWPCATCGQMTASNRQAARLGVATAGDGRDCATCYQRRRQGWRNRPCGSRRPGRRGRREEQPDWVVVERLIAGTFAGDPTHAELHDAILRLTARQMSAREIAIRLRITPRTVTRHRATAGQTTARGAAA